jgi:hypothetical protein
MHSRSGPFSFAVASPVLIVGIVKPYKFGSIRQHFSENDHAMQILVDADTCPGIIKEILFRVVQRTKIQITLIDSPTLRIPPSPFIRPVQVPSNIDAVDHSMHGRHLPTSWTAF